MDILSLIISLISGAAGGNIAGALLKDKNLGVLGNSLAGIFGGGIGSTLLQAVGLLAPTIYGADNSIDIATVLGNVASGGVGGSVLLLIISFLKDMFKK